MADTTFEEASRCPTCQEMGVRVNVRNAPREFPPGTQVHVFECRSDRCEDYLPPSAVGPNFTQLPASRNRWFVQTNPDGSVPPKDISRNQPKAFAPINDNSMAAQRARDQLAHLAEMDTARGSELR